MSFDPYEFDRSLAQDSRLETLGQYTAKTFLWMVLGLMVTFAVALVSWMTGAVRYVLDLRLLILIATLVLSFTMARQIETMSVGMAKAAFLAFSALFGLTMSIYLLIYQLTSVILVFAATAVYFAVLAAYGYLTRRSLAGWRTILISGLLFLIVYLVVTWFIPGLSAFDQMVSLVGIALFLAYTAYDTQKIKDYYYYYSGYPDMLEKASVFSALQLYLDFLNLFLYLLRYLGKRKN